MDYLSLHLYAQKIVYMELTCDKDGEYAPKGKNGTMTGLPSVGMWRLARYGANLMKNSPRHPRSYWLGRENMGCGLNHFRRILHLSF